MSASSKTLYCVPYVSYPVWFQGGQAIEDKALTDFNSKINIMNPAFRVQLSRFIWPIDIDAQKIDGFALKTYNIVIVGFSIQDKLDRIWFFKETFLLADTSIKVVLEIPFLTLSNANIQFDTQSFT